MKPYVLFFDEICSEHYYRYDTVQSYVDEADCLIIVGSALETNFVATIADTFLRKDLPVIELNPESLINRGFNI